MNVEDTSDHSDRTPRELAREALELAATAKTDRQAMRANTMALVALAGEVHALNESGKEPRTINLEIGAP